MEKINSGKYNGLIVRDELDDIPRDYLLKIFNEAKPQLTIDISKCIKFGTQ